MSAGPSSPWEVTEAVSFPEAIAFTQKLSQAIAAGELTEGQITGAVASLVRTSNGARGFFVAFLAGEEPLADAPPEAVLAGLGANPEGAAELLVKNAAMSSAMAIAHRRNDDETAALGSERVRRRTLALIEQLGWPHLRAELQQLDESARTGTGVYASFLDKWGYDAEQRQVIRDAIASVR